MCAELWRHKLGGCVSMCVCATMVVIACGCDLGVRGRRYQTPLLSSMDVSDASPVAMKESKVRVGWLKIFRLPKEWAVCDIRAMGRANATEWRFRIEAGGQELAIGVVGPKEDVFLKNELRAVLRSKTTFPHEPSQVSVQDILNDYAEDCDLLKAIAELPAGDPSKGGLRGLIKEEQKIYALSELSINLFGPRIPTRLKTDNVQVFASATSVDTDSETYQLCRAWVCGLSGTAVGSVVLVIPKSVAPTPEAAMQMMVRLTSGIAVDWDAEKTSGDKSPPNLGS